MSRITLLLGALLWIVAIALRLSADPVTITNAVSGQGLVLGTGTYESGSTVTLRAVPQVDWQFERWRGVPEEMAVDNPLTLEAEMGLQPRALFVEADGNGRPQGSVVAWGRGHVPYAAIPMDLRGVIAIAAGSDHSLALRSDGTVVAWGNDGLIYGYGEDAFGQLTVPTGLRAVAISAGN
jgi:hypothetical protein